MKRPVFFSAGKPKIQFSKKQVIFADVLVVVVWLGEFILRLLGKEGVSDVAIAIITAYGAFATGGYFTLAGTRDCSLNKYVHSHGAETRGEE